MAQFPQFQTVPFFVFCESYGGKMTSQFATALLAAIDAGTIKTNFRGIAIGDSWISGIDFVDTWGPYLRATSLMDSTELAAMNANSVGPCDAAVAAGQWANATHWWGVVENDVSTYSCVNFYNTLQVDCSQYSPDAILANLPRLGVLSPASAALAPEGVSAASLQTLFARHVAPMLRDPLDTLMNGVIKTKLGIIPANVTWGGQSGDVFSALSGDFMRPVIDVVDGLLAGGRINVTVYEGQVDLICSTMGAELWMTRLTWPGMPGFYASTKSPRSAFAGAPTGAFTRSAAPLHMWYIMLAGHMVPSDNGDMALAMVQEILATQS